jgi:hypothetical protein
MHGNIDNPQNSSLPRGPLLRRPPKEIYPFIDRCRIWLRRPLSKDQLRQLRAACWPTRIKPFNELCRFDSRYRQRLEILTPLHPVALAALAALPPEARVSYIELALDIVLPASVAPRAVRDFLRSSICLPYCRKAQAQAYDNMGFTTRRLPKGTRRRGTWVSGYADRESKITGEDCLHLELRFEGVRAVRRLNVHHPKDLARIDFVAAFCLIQVYELDLARLGRFHANRMARTRRQKTIDSDLKLGRRLYRRFAADARGRSFSLQSLIQNYGKGPYLIRDTESFYVHRAMLKLLVLQTYGHYSKVPVIAALHAFFHASTNSKQR